ncbi:Isobutyryl-CoA dehydrogenase, mitochondrial [Halotydeus destructor]|nr:Isobutyryl-CoA dehydrogenase, mitochondrial [Halotydeus destructor]
MAGICCRSSIRFFNNLNRTTRSITAARYNSSVRGSILDPSLGLNEDERQLQDMALNFAINEFRPNMRKWDEDKTFPVDAMRKGAALGFGAAYLAAEFGGTGLSRLESSVLFEALSMGDCSTTAWITVHNMPTWMIGTYGNDKQREKYIPDLASMERFCSYCLTEPGAGSDAGNLQTTAEKKGDYYVLNGSKAFISGSYPENVFVIMCRTGGPGPKGISALIMDGAQEGFTLNKPERKLGWNTHPARILTFEDVKIPVENLLGKEGDGFKMAMQGLNGGRLNVASCSLGAAQWAVEEMMQYTTARKQFGKQIASFQNTQFKLADMAAELYSVRLAIRAAARELDYFYKGGKVGDGHVSPAQAAAAAKLVGTEKCFQIIDDCLQLFGGYGYLYDFPIQQLLRDTRVHRILEGTNEIMKHIISRELLHDKLEKELNTELISKF